MQNTPIKEEQTVMNLGLSISDEEIQELLPRNIEDISVEEKTIICEFEKLRTLLDFQEIVRRNGSVQDRKVFSDFLTVALNDEGITLSAAKRWLFEKMLHFRRKRQILPLSQKMAPLLHKMVGHLAVALQIQKPLIFIGDGLSHYAAAYDWALLNGPPMVIIDGPVFAIFDDSMLKALLAHECGHIKGKHHILRQLLIITPLILGSFLSAVLCKGLGQDWKITLLFAYELTWILLKISSTKGILGWFCRLAEKSADSVAIGLGGPIAFVRSLLPAMRGVIKTKKIFSSTSDDSNIFGGNDLSKAAKLSRMAFEEGFRQEEDSDTLMNSIRTANNDSHPSCYERIVAAAKIWAKNLAATRMHAN